jgi:hypothetical protein
MKRDGNAQKQLNWRWAGAALLIAAAAGVALYSLNRTTSNPSPLAGKSSSASTAAIQPSARGEAAAAMPEAASTQPAATPPGSAIPAGGATYFIDPDTKQPHAPSAEEMQALVAAGPTVAAGRRLAAASQPQPIVGVNGAPGLRLTDEQMSYSVATRNAAGTVSVEHAEGKTEAVRKVRAASAGGTTAGKGQPDVR